MPADSAIVVSDVTHRYGERVAVDQLSLTIDEGEIFVFLGPNGSGKTTLFRLLSTLIPVQAGEVTILGHKLSEEITAARGELGVVFQSPSLDKKLTVAENLSHQGRLYGLSAAEIESRSLDPGARADLWHYLQQVREEGVTIVLTTHLLEEAERADRIAIMHQGKIAALDTPAALQASVGGDSITIRAERPDELAIGIREKFDCAATVIDRSVRLEQPDGHRWISRLVEAFPDDIQR